MENLDCSSKLNPPLNSLILLDLNSKNPNVTLIIHSYHSNYPNLTVLQMISLSDPHFANQFVAREQLFYLFFKHSQVHLSQIYSLEAKTNEKTNCWKKILTE